MTQPREAFDGLPTPSPIGSVPEADIVEALGDGLVLRRSGPADIEALAEFNAVVQADPPDWERFQHVANWTRQLMDGSHPTARARDFLVVHDTSNDRVASTLCLLSHTLAYDGIALPCGMPELVGTHPAYRTKRFIARQFAEVHAWSEARGDLVQIIDGIPWYYRQYGYEMAAQRFGGMKVPKDGLPKDEPGGLRVRRATVDDAAFLDAAYRAGMERYRLSCVRDEAFWRFETGGRADLSTQTRQLFIVETPGGEPRGFFNLVPILLDEGHTFTTAFEVGPGASFEEVTPAVLAALASKGPGLQTDEDEPFVGAMLAVGEDHPSFAVLDGATPRDPYAWYVRVPDLPAFVQQVAPALEARLAASDQAGATTTLAINRFRDGIRIELEQGRIREVGAWRPSTEVLGDVTFPELSFLHLLLGHRSFDTLFGFYADCLLHEKGKRPLLEALFPKQASFIMATS